VTRTLVIGVLLFLVFAVVFAPASLLRTLLPGGGGVELLEPSGTLWDGAADLYLDGQAAGRMHWDFDPMMMLQGALGYDVALGGPEHDVTGTVSLGPMAGEATLEGRASAAFANRWLAPYDIAVGGELKFRQARVRIPYDYPGPEAESGSGVASGSVAWTGGPVRYRLSGRSYAGNLPPLVAYLGDKLEAVVIPENGQTPLLRAEILTNGFVRIGVTKLLTNLVGNPWPGSHADHEVVLEVEEQLF
jgi:hypothetical protein